MPPSTLPDDVDGDGVGRPPPATDRASTLSPDPLLGTTIDGVRIVRKLGEGGFAFVYEGRQRSEPTVVAVKVLKPRLATPGLVRRFEYEAEILTRLVHPGIARVHRLARTSVEGVEVPCIVMEIVPAAKPITKYSGDLALPVPDRVALLAEAAEAIGHGHRLGVLHRDVKPGNILVGPDGQPKVIDFGWARGLDSAAVLQSAGTAFGQFVGTFQYMSPEQFDPDPAAVDIRADVWALGAVLQELLTGKPPHEYQGGPLFHFATAVRETPPTPLPTDDRSIDRQLRTIVATCLAKDTNRRYASAVELAADLRRHLAGEPIAPASTGLRDTLLYLARKHAAAAIAAAVSLAALVAATVGIGFFLIRSDRALRAEAETAARLRAESRRASDEAARAQAETDNARRQLYVANLHRLALPDAGRPSAVRRLFDETARIVAPTDRRHGDRDLPLELLCLRPRVFQPIRHHGGESAADVTDLAVNASGDRFATACDDGTVTLRDADGRLVAALRPGSGAHRLLFTPRWLAAASGDGSLTLVDAVTGANGATLPFDVGITALAADAAGSLLVAGCDDGTLRAVRFDADGSAAEPVVIRAHRRKVGAVAVSPDGTRLAATSRDGTCRLLETGEGRELAVFPAPRDRPGCVAFSADGRRLAHCGPELSIGVVDTVTNATTRHPAGHSDRIRALAFSPDGRTLASASDDGTAILHDTERGVRVATLVAHRGPVTSLAFAPDGRSLATGSADGTVRLWRGADGALERTLEGHEDPIAAIAFAPDGRSLLSAGGDGLTLQWDTTTPEGSRVLRGHETAFDGVLFLPRSTRFVGYSHDGSARLWDAATAAEIVRFPGHRGPIRTAAASPDGTTIALGVDDDDVVVLHDVRDGSPRATLRGHARRLTSLDFSPDGTLLASASDDGTARIWSVADGSCRRELTGHAGSVLAVRFSPDGTTLATAARDGTARLWPVTGDGPPNVLSGHGALVRTIAFAPDGRSVATGSDDGTARLWLAGSGVCTGTLRAGTSAVTRLAFVGGGRRLVTGRMRGGLDLWDVATAGHVTPLEGHAAEIRAIVVTPDGTRFATASSDRTVRIWDAEEGTELLLLRGHAAPILGLAISGDGRELVTTSADRTVRLWARTDAEIRETRLLADRPEKRQGRVADTPAGHP